jgi:hypothetical protein
VVLKLQPEQIGLFWDAISHAFLSAGSVPKSNTEKWLSGCLAALMSGISQCWLIYDRKEEEFHLYAVVVSQLVNDPLSGQLVLMLGPLYGFRKMEDAMMIDAVEKICRYGVSQNCVRTVVWSPHPRVQDWAIKCGFVEASRIFIKEYT